MIDEIENYKNFMSEGYLEHKIFTLIKELEIFYESISFNSIQFLSSGVQELFNIDSYIFSSIEGTLNSIGLVLKNGRINDAYALTRKYNDAIVIDIYRWQLIEDKRGVQFIVKEIDDWVKGEQSSKGYKGCMNYIKKSQNLNALNEFFNFEDGGLYEKIRRRCNDNSHYNSLYHMMLNDNNIYNKNRIKELDQLFICLKQLSILHFAYIIYLHEEYISSTDYVDCLDLGLQPEEGSQYWVANFAQEYFNKYILSSRPKLATVLRERTCMNL